MPRITVGMGTCGRGNGAEGIYQSFVQQIDKSGADIYLASVGCFGSCFQEPLVTVRLPGMPMVILRRVQPNDVVRIVHDLQAGRITPDLAFCKISEWDHITANVRYGSGYPELQEWNEIAFFKPQKKIVLRNCGLINPDDIEEYIGVGGYQALYKVLIEGHPEMVIEQIKAAKLRGRGGAGYLTGNKWEFMAKAKADQKFIICNADEGDPGAYMNRNEIESDPHALLEGMAIGAYVMGATHGIIYVRAEYPLAVHRLRSRARAGARVRNTGREHPGTRIQVRHPVGGRCGSVCLRRRDGADCVARRTGRKTEADDLRSRRKKVCGACPRISTTWRPGTTCRRS